MKTKFYLIAIFIFSLSQLYAISNNTIKNDYKTDINGITFCIDKRIELFNVIAYLADYPYLNGLDYSYKNDIETYFAKYRKHPTVVNFESLFRKSFHSIDAPIFFMVCLDDELNYITQPQDVFNREYADSLRNMFIKFRKECKFDEFYGSHKDFYNLILSTVQFNFKDYREKERIENYYGSKQNSYTVILNLLGSGNFGPGIKNVSGMDIYCVIEPETTMGNIPVFSANRMFNNLICHEFGHSFVNPLVEKYIETVNKSSALFDSIKQSMNSQAYTNWEITVKEHIVRAVACRLAAKKYGEESSNLIEYRNEVGRRFIYVVPLIAKLKEYEREGKRQNSFDVFFPELLSVFERIKPEDISDYQKIVESLRKPDISIMPEFGNVDAEKLLIITPTEESDSISQQQLLGFINEYKQQFFPDSKLVSDKEALKMDVSNYDILVFGTPNSNVFLKKHIEQIPVFISPEKIVADKEYVGDNFQMLISWVNPLNENRHMSIYTAQKTHDIININTIMPGNNFTIAKNYKIIKKGEYKKSMNIWFCE
ncbi:MAG: DUF4932 domain-containing protein [Bacteroidales bacterium]|nr:DUF4932 domain-containing protein [Bacteroidales bacterium]